MEIYYKGELIGRIEADQFQNTFPWCTGRVVPTAAMEKYLEFFAWYEEAELEFSYAPFREEAYEYFQCDDTKYPRDDEERYRRSELYTYTEALKRLYHSVQEHDMAEVSRIVEDDAWNLSKWLKRWDSECDDRKFAAYLEFLDYRNWKVSDEGEEVPWLPHPPAFDLDDMSIAWR